MKVALSIAGSDSGAGAGIQADLKTFSALGVYGCTAITAITAQNTKKVAKIAEIPPDMVVEQIRSVLSDIPPDAIKIGMVYSRKIIDSIYSILKDSRIPIVLDPILAAGSGGKLLLDDAFDSFVSKLLPICTLITPNMMEASRISGVKIKSEGNVLSAAKEIRKMGAGNAIVKGGHFGLKDVTDILLREDGRVIRFTNPRIRVKETHGSGCNFSAAVTSFIARGFELEDACLMANEYVHQAISRSLKIGKGLPVTNPISGIYDEAIRYQVTKELEQAVREIERLNGFGKLIPETQSNFVLALPDASEISDVAGVTGRIIKINSFGKAASSISFGSSKHVASAVLAYMKINRAYRSAINIRIDEKILKTCKSLLRVSDYDRAKEPANIKKKEGMTVGWGIGQALKKNPEADVVYHYGDVGKEPMIMIFGKNTREVVDKVKSILKNYES